MTVTRAIVVLAAAALAAATAVAQDAAPAAIRTRVAEALAGIDAARIEADVRTLVGFGTRHVLSRTDSDTEGTGAARKWLRERFEAIAAAAWYATRSSSPSTPSSSSR